MRRALLSAVLLLAAPLGAQDDPVESHLYNVEFLTAGIPDHPGESLGLAQDAIGTAVAAGEEFRPRIPGGDLVKLVCANIAPGSWEDDGVKIDDVGGVLSVKHRKSVHAKIGPYLDAWRAAFGRFITLDAFIVSAEPAFAAKLRAAGDPDRPCVLTAESMRQLLDAARDGKQADLLRTMRLAIQPGQRVSLQELTRQSYVRDYDVQIASAAGELDPIVDVLSIGPSVDVRAYLEPWAGGVTLETRLDAVEFEAMNERKLRLSKDLMTMIPMPGEAGKGPESVKGPVVTLPMERKVQLPVIQHDRIRTMLTVRDRESAVAGTLLRKNRCILYILTPGIVAPEQGGAPPAGTGERAMRLFDISPLTRGVQDYSGPRLDLASPSHGGGGPLTGAVFTLDEPQVFMDSSQVEQQIESRIAPGTWEDKANKIDHAGNGQLLVTHKPEVLKQIDALLTGLIAARARTITTETVVVAFKKGARSEWEKEIPALAPGGYFAESPKVEKLLEEAYRGQRVRLVDAAEVTGLPQQLVVVTRTREEAYLQDYEPQVSSYASAMDPIIGVFTTGFTMNVRPSFVHGTDRITVDFRASHCSGETGEVEALGPGAGALQTAKVKVQNWNSTVICEKGRYSLVASGRMGTGEDAEDVAVFVRCRPNLLK